MNNSNLGLLATSPRPKRTSRSFFNFPRHEGLRRRFFDSQLKLVVFVLLVLVLYFTVTRFQSSSYDTGVNKSGFLEEQGLSTIEGDVVEPEAIVEPVTKGTQSTSEPISHSSAEDVPPQTTITVTAPASKPDDIDYQRFVQVYAWKYKRLPPAGLQKWFNYAKSNKCILDDYDFVDKQLDVFRKRGGITKQMIERAKNVPRTFTVAVKNGQFATQDGYFGGWVQPLLGDFVHDLPDFEAVWNTLDEPRVLFPSYMTPGKSIESFRETLNPPSYHQNNNTKLMWEICKHIPSIKKNGPYHGFFNYPATLDFVVDLVPIFSYGHLPDCFADLIIPSQYAVNEVRNERLEGAPSWTERKNQVLWRGSTTSSHLEPWHDFETANRINHRIRFVTNFHDNPKFDIGITNIVQCDPASKCQESLSNVPKGGPVDHKNHYIYKYLWDMDGNGSSGRFIHFLKNSLAVVLRAKLYSEWLDAWIIPGKHYLKFDFDYHRNGTTTLDIFKESSSISNQNKRDQIPEKSFTELPTATEEILQALEWLEKNDAKARLMAEETSKFANEHLRLEDMKCFTYRYILEYASLLQ